MGVYDEIFLQKDVIEDLNIRCDKCDELFSEHNRAQTKDFHSSMDAYFIKYNVTGQVKIFKLGKPDDKYYRYFTDKEIEEWNKNYATSWFKKEKGDGYYLDEAYYPENRKQRSMGELPHQWVDIWYGCVCGHQYRYNIQFTNGVITKVEREIDES